MRHLKQGPVIRQDEQLVVIVEQELSFKKSLWKGSLEIERQTFQTYGDIAQCIRDTADCSIMKVLRVCMSDHSVEDITEKVVEADHLARFQSEHPTNVYNPVKEHSTLSHRIQGLRA